MARVRYEDGTVINFDGTPTPDDLEFAYRQTKNIPQTTSTPAESPLPTMQDVLRSGGEYIGNTAQAILHPIQTAQGIGNLALGGAQKLIPCSQPQEVYADAFGQVIQQRYG